MSNVIPRMLVYISTKQITAYTSTNHQTWCRNGVVEKDKCDGNIL